MIRPFRRARLAAPNRTPPKAPPDEVVAYRGGVVVRRLADRSGFQLHRHETLLCDCTTLAAALAALDEHTR